MLNIKQLTGQDESFLVNIPESLKGSNSKTIQKMHPDVVEPLLELGHLAEKDGQPFKVISSYRNFERQKLIWNRKFNGETPLLDQSDNVIDINGMKNIELIRSIMLYSALPGASRHHWGSDFDIFPSSAVENGYPIQLTSSEFSNSGVAAPLNRWLSENLHKTDFFRPYERYQKGVAAEPWHISYRPLSEQALEQLSSEKIKTVIEESNDLAGGDEICNQMDELYRDFIDNICR